jgi:hypothetical protein
MEQSVNELEEFYPEFKQEFQSFFPELKLHAEEFLKAADSQQHTADS